MILDEGYADLVMDGIPSEFYSPVPSSAQRTVMLYDHLLRVIWNPQLKQWWTVRRIESRRPFRMAWTALVGWMPLFHFDANVSPDMVADVAVDSARRRDRWRQGQDTRERQEAAQRREALAHAEAAAAAQALRDANERSVLRDVFNDKVSVGYASRGGGCALSDEAAVNRWWAGIARDVLAAQGLDDESVEREYEATREALGVSGK